MTILAYGAEWPARPTPSERDVLSAATFVAMLATLVAHPVEAAIDFVHSVSPHAAEWLARVAHLVDSTAVHHAWILSFLGFGGG